MIWRPSTLHTLLFVVCAFIVLNCINQRVSENDDFTLSKPSMTTRGPFSAGQEQHQHVAPIVSPVENGFVQILLPGETMESFVQPVECTTVKDIHVVLWWKRADRPYDFFSPDLFGVPYAVNRIDTICFFFSAYYAFHYAVFFAHIMLKKYAFCPTLC